MASPYRLFSVPLAPAADPAAPRLRAGSSTATTTKGANLSLRAVARPLQRSSPELDDGSDRRFENSRKDVMQTATEEYKVPYSRSFTGRTHGGYSRTSSISTVDTKNVQLYLRRQESRASLHSSASAGLVTSDTVSSASSSHSRPVSADTPNNTAAQSQPTGVNTAPQPATAVNTRLILPSPSMPRIFPPSLMNPISRSTSIPSLAARHRSSYLDKLVCRVCDYLYMGGIEAAYNANLLCRLNIEYVIDISNVEPLKVPRHKRSDCPCLCPLTTPHSRVRMTIMIEENSAIDLFPYFDDVNRFIDSARSCNKSVLVHSYNGRNRCAALVAQYLMKTRKLNSDRALGLLKSMRPDVNVSENFLKSLRRWETIIQQARGGAGPEDDESSKESSKDSGASTSETRPFIGPFNNAKFGYGVPVTKRSAWVCTLTSMKPNKVSFAVTVRACERSAVGVGVMALWSSRKFGADVNVHKKGQSAKIKHQRGTVKPESQDGGDLLDAKARVDHHDTPIFYSKSRPAVASGEKLSAPPQVQEKALDPEPVPLSESLGQPSERKLPVLTEMEKHRSVDKGDPIRKSGPSVRVPHEIRPLPIPLHPIESPGPGDPKKLSVPRVEFGGEAQPATPSRPSSAGEDELLRAAILDRDPAMSEHPLSPVETSGTTASTSSEPRTISERPAVEDQYEQIKPRKQTKGIPYSEAPPLEELSDRADVVSSYEKKKKKRRSKKRRRRSKLIICLGKGQRRKRSKKRRSTLVIVAIVLVLVLCVSLCIGLTAWALTNRKKAAAAKTTTTMKSMIL